jgi:MSHA biogenesis protein MshN
VRHGHEWFWRILAVLVLISLTWVAWVAYQLQPRNLVTPAALSAAAQSGGGTIVAAKPALAPAPAPALVQVVEAPKPEPVQANAEPIKPAETFKLARSIETPIAERRSRPAKAEAKKPRAQPIAQPFTQPVTQSVAAPSPSTKVVVDKRERSKAVNEVAETRFRRAATLLNQGRVSEAEEQLAAALQADPSHVHARQAYVALLLEQQRVPSALRLLREAVDTNPSQPIFSLGLARVYAEQREYPAALEVLDKAGASAQGAEFQALRGTVLQRLGRHAEAVRAYHNALERSSQPGGTWTGLGISLEALGRHGEAAQAYQRALGAGPLPRELRDYAEARIRALQ